MTGQAILVAAADRREENSPQRLGVLFDAHHQRLYRLARRLCGTAEDSQDLVQETFLRAARSPASIPAGTPHEEAWLVRVLINIARDRWRRQAVHQKNAAGEAIMATQKITWRAKPGNLIRPGFYGEFQFRLRNPATPQRVCYSIDQWYNARRQGGKPQLVSWSGASTSATPASCVDVVAG